MAVIYYPKNQLMFIRDTTVSASNFESVVLNVQPNTVLYFDTSSLINNVNAQMIPITASWALTASVSTVFATTVSASWATQSLSSSYATTASFALNGVGGGNGPYTLITASANLITLDFNVSEVFVNLTAAALYSFTASNPPVSSSMASTTLFISHSVTTATSSLSFPTNWSFLGSTPTYITNSRVAMLTLKAYGPQYFVGAYAVQF